MRLLIEIAAAALFIICISVSSAAFAGPTADGLSCSFSVAKSCLTGRALRRHQAAMQRQILRELLRRQVGVGREVRS